MTPYYFTSGYHENRFQQLFADNNGDILELPTSGAAFANVPQEMMRLYKAVSELPARLLFGVFLLPVWCGLRLCMALRYPEAAYSPFGYHVRPSRRPPT